MLARWSASRSAPARSAAIGVGVPAGLVVGYDGSDCARAALDAAIELSRGLGEPIALVFGYDPPGSVGEEYGAHRDAVRARAEEATSEGAERARVLQDMLDRILNFFR